MRLFITLLLIFFSSFVSPSFAQVASTDGSLKQHMKEIGELFKGIGMGIKDPSQNGLNADAASRMASLFQLTQQQVPEALAQLQEPQLSEAFQKYQEMIQQCIDWSLQLQQAFLNNDNTTANEIYRQMKDLKELGHEKFDP